jgi:hypothetical protein
LLKCVFIQELYIFYIFSQIAASKLAPTDHCRKMLENSQMSRQVLELLKMMDPDRGFMQIYFYFIVP